MKNEHAIELRRACAAEGLPTFGEVLSILEQDPDVSSSRFDSWRFREKLLKGFYEDPISVVNLELAIESLIDRLGKILGNRNPSIFLESIILFLNLSDLSDLDAGLTKQILGGPVSERNPLLARTWQWALWCSEHQPHQKDSAHYLEEITSAMDEVSDCPLWQATLCEVLLSHVKDLPASLVWRCVENIHFVHKEHPCELMERLLVVEDPDFANNAKTLLAEWTEEFLSDSLPETIQEPYHLEPAIRFFSKTDRSMVSRLRAHPYTNVDDSVRQALVDCGFEESDFIVSAKPDATRSEILKRSEKWRIADFADWKEDSDATKQLFSLLQSELGHGNVKPLAQWLSAMRDDFASDTSDYNHRFLLGDFSQGLTANFRRALISAKAFELESLLPGLRYFVSYPHPSDHTAQWQQELLFAHLLCDKSNEYVEWTQSSSPHWFACLSDVWGLAADRANHFELDDSARWQLVVDFCSRASEAGLGYLSDQEQDVTDLCFDYCPDDLKHLVPLEHISQHGHLLAASYGANGELWRRIARIRGQLKQWDQAIEAMDNSLAETADDTVRQRREREKEIYQQQR